MQLQSFISDDLLKVCSIAWLLQFLCCLLYRLCSQHVEETFISMFTMATRKWIQQQNGMCRALEMFLPGSEYRFHGSAMMTRMQRCVLVVSVTLPV